MGKPKFIKKKLSTSVTGTFRITISVSKKSHYKNRIHFDNLKDGDNLLLEYMCNPLMISKIPLSLKYQYSNEVLTDITIHYLMNPTFDQELVNIEILIMLNEENLELLFCEASSYSLNKNQLRIKFIQMRANSNGQIKIQLSQQRRNVDPIDFIRVTMESINILSSEISAKSILKYSRDSETRSEIETQRSIKDEYKVKKEKKCVMI